MSQEFQQKAERIMQILTNITSKDQPKSLFHLEDIQKLKNQISQSEESNFNKIKNLHEQIRLIHQSLQQQARRRSLAGERFYLTIANIEKNIKNSLSIMEKKYIQSEKQVASKVDDLISTQNQIISSNLSNNQKQQKQLTEIENRITLLNNQTILMRKKRCELENQIYYHFSNQIKQLKTRQDKERMIYQQLKKLSKKIIDGIKEQTTQRQTNQKVFLKILEQLVRKIQLQE